ncbi:DUF1398 domain-containing protein [Mucilaginibacter sp. AK015]|uniref:DUF1398 domain-containing protein n=1 Tax=Mucilaginibacter sp. AK015 TaxID=2723072 RepID=UPI0016183842|nr:DUF1398 family protein [Mucilaginibacter sp. AK015]MBB5395222.1 uncharacterized protein YbcV (DUF1398 family) [Mucilaginibacter sp. AK015]
MFTLQQMKAAHAKVKTGADFPCYVQEIKALGLKRYTYSVTDGTTTYYGENGYQVPGPAIYEPKVINPVASPEKLRYFIEIHQQGQTDFLTLCGQVATAGVRQWVVDTERMLCLYEDADGREMVVEPIPDTGY